MKTFSFENIHPREIDNPAREIFSRDQIEQRRKASADKLLAALLSGAIINRKNCSKNCHHHGVGEFNCSLHSLVSDLQNRREIPVSRQYDADGMADYFIATDHKAEFLDPERRPAQAARIRRENIARRMFKDMNRAIRTIRAAADFPEVCERFPFVIAGIQQIHTEAGRTIKKESRRDKVSTAANGDIFENLTKSEVSGNG